MQRGGIQVKTWVGGVQNMDTAQNLMGQGGIPNVALTKGCVDVALRMEHVWVEAFYNGGIHFVQYT